MSLAVSTRVHSQSNWKHKYLLKAIAHCSKSAHSRQILCAPVYPFGKFSSPRVCVFVYSTHTYPSNPFICSMYVVECRCEWESERSMCFCIRMFFLYSLSSACCECVYMSTLMHKVHREHTYTHTYSTHGRSNILLAINSPATNKIEQTNVVHNASGCKVKEKMSVHKTVFNTKHSSTMPPKNDSME